MFCVFSNHTEKNNKVRPLKNITNYSNIYKKLYLFLQRQIKRLQERKFSTHKFIIN